VLPLQVLPLAMLLVAVLLLEVSQQVLSFCQLVISIVCCRQCP
jgi:hypothetical protein